MGPECVSPLCCCVLIYMCEIVPRRVPPLRFPMREKCLALLIAAEQRAPCGHPSSLPYVRRSTPIHLSHMAQSVSASITVQQPTSLDAQTHLSPDPSVYKPQPSTPAQHQSISPPAPAHQHTSCNPSAAIPRVRQPHVAIPSPPIRHQQPASLATKHSTGLPVPSPALLHQLPGLGKYEEYTLN